MWTNSWNITGDRTFPDDRRYALLKLKEGTMGVEDSEKEFDPNNPSWLHNIYDQHLYIPMSWKFVWSVINYAPLVSEYGFWYSYLAILVVHSPELRCFLVSYNSYIIYLVSFYIILLLCALTTTFQRGRVSLYNWPSTGVLLALRCLSRVLLVLLFSCRWGYNFWLWFYPSLW